MLIFVYSTCTVKEVIYITLLVKYAFSKAMWMHMEGNNRQKSMHLALSCLLLYKLFITFTHKCHFIFLYRCLSNSTLIFLHSLRYTQFYVALFSYPPKFLILSSSLLHYYILISISKVYLITPKNEAPPMKSNTSWMNLMPI